MPLNRPAPHLPLVRDLAAWDRTIHALATNRITELLELVDRGQVLPLPPETDLAIEEDLATLVRVRVLTGAERGAVGWLPSGLLPRPVAA